MKDQIMLNKIEPFLLEIYHELVIKKNKKLKLRHILIKHKMSDSSREALFKSKILTKKNYGTASSYKWCKGLPCHKMYEDFLKTLREINSDYSKRYRKNKQQKPVELVENYNCENNRFSTTLKIISAVVLVSSFLIYKKLKK